jgi:hypothetical protein
MRHLIPIHSHSFQRLAFALNHPCLLTEHASSDRNRQYEAVIVFVALGELQITREKTDIQRPPDSRMNRLPKHFDRLSLVDTIGQLSWSQGPPKQSPATPQPVHYWCVSAATFLYTKTDLSIPLFELSTPLLRGPCMLSQTCQDAVHHYNCTSTTSLLQTSKLETPSSWPAP